MKGRFLCILAASIAFVSFKEHKEASVTSIDQLFTDGSSKSWYISRELPGDEKCGASTDMIRDNSLIFFKAGKFQFDSGTVTENSACNDFINVTGKWSFQNNDSTLLITLSHATDDPSITFDNDTLMFADITTLTETSIGLSCEGKEIMLTSK